MPTQQISLSYGLGLLFNLYFFLLVLRIFLTWFPNIDWEQEPFGFIARVCDPVLNMFRGIIPPIGGVLDISPIIPMILLQIFAGLLIGLLRGMGL